MCVGEEHCSVVKKVRKNNTTAIFSGDDFNGFGSCEGDSGSPLIKYDSTTGGGQFTQIGMVQGGVGACGDRKIPSIYIRLRDPEIMSFIRKITGKT